jgi:23S rRNA (cytidine1920-2'-O)/16S rRNA (cytidine1409-2'-O)-methyltransferase
LSPYLLSFPPVGSATALGVGVTKVRLDQLLVARGLAPSRARAQAIVMAGEVFVSGARADKAGALVAEDAAVKVRAPDHPYVSRGGVKLAGALDAFALDVRGLRCLDVGASTGGFTDCLLQRGAARVVAVDVGYGQLAHKLQTEPRVVALYRTNARSLTAEAIGGAVDLTVVDASFIGLAKLMPAIARCTLDGGDLVALVKPQFEVGRREAARGKGVVRDEPVRLHAIAAVMDAIRAAGFAPVADRESVLPGPKGNREQFVHAKRALVRSP